MGAPKGGTTATCKVCGERVPFAKIRNHHKVKHGSAKIVVVDEGGAMDANITVESDDLRDVESMPNLEAVESTTPDETPQPAAPAAPKPTPIPPSVLAPVLVETLCSVVDAAISAQLPPHLPPGCPAMPAAVSDDEKKFLSVAAEPVIAKYLPMLESHPELVLLAVGAMVFGPRMLAARKVAAYCADQKLRPLPTPAPAAQVVHAPPVYDDAALLALGDRSLNQMKNLGVV